MKNLLPSLTAILLLSFTSQSQFKEYINKSIYTTLDTRFDYVAQSFTSEVFPDKNSQNYQFSDFLLQFGVDFSEQIGLVFRYVPYDGKRDFDGISDNFQYAYVDLFSKDKKWNLSIGKFFMQVGTGEQFYDPNDVYTYSLVANNLGVFKSGVSLNYTTETGQNFGLQMVNSSLLNESNEPEYFEYNVNYYGNLFQGRIMPLLSYSYIPKTGGYSVNTGIMWDFHPIHINTDYELAYNMPNFFSNIYYQSIPIRIAYNGQKFKPFVKFIANSMISDGDSTSIDLLDSSIEITNYHFRTYEGGVQYYPIPGKNLRFHIVCNYSSDYDIDILVPDPVDNTSRGHTTTEFQFYAGIRIGVDFFKGIKSI